MIRILAAALVSSTCLTAFVTPATAQAAIQTVNFQVAPGPLRTALDAFVRQSGRQVIFRGDEVGSQKSPGVQGLRTAEDALNAILAGTGFTVRRDTSGAFAVVRAAQVSRSDEEDGLGTSSLADGVASQDQAEDIVVTGTLIRGIAPTGTNVVALGREQIATTGAMTTNEVLANVPQVTSSFMSVPTITSDGGNTSVRPNLRDLGRASGSTTLVLIDGHRVVPNGGTDPDMIPPGALERVEIVPDGGSSIYGSDAIGGVINLITRRSFDGFEAMARRGWANEYTTSDVSLTAGKKWDSGSAFISYFYQKNDALFGRDLDFMRDPSGDSSYCLPGTVVSDTGTFPLPGRPACDSTDDTSFRPAAERQSIYAAFNQDITDFLNFDVRGYYTTREYIASLLINVASPQNLAVPSTNFYFNPAYGTNQTVRTTFAGAFDRRSSYRNDQVHIIPTLTAKLGGTWQLRASGAYQWSRNRELGNAVDSGAVGTALAGTTAATALNPYNIGASNPNVLAGILREFFSSSQSRLYQARVVTDGSLFTLPGGDVRVAVGAEYLEEQSSDNRRGNYLPGQGATAPLTVADSKRRVKSLFGELIVPVFGAENGGPGYQALSLSASGRYDSYSDFGSTFNPKFGIDYTPFDGLKIRGNWGTSFNAPPMGLQGGFQATQILPPSIFPVPGQQAPLSLILAGFVPNIQPQTADTWSVGFEAQPKAVPGLNLGATYYNIHLKDQIGLLAGAPLAFTPELSQYLQDNQTCGQVLSKYSGFIPFGPSAASICAANPAQTFAVLDLQQQNLGQLKQQGIDFNVSYQRPTSFGSVNASFAGTYILSRKSAIAPGLPFVDELQGLGTSRLFFVASLGAQSGDVTANVSFNHRQGYDLNPPATTARFGTQTHVSSFNVVDLFLAYKLPAEWLPSETSLTLNVDNLFDQNPPFYNGCAGVGQCGSINGATLGRMFTIGIRTKF